MSFEPGGDPDAPPADRRSLSRLVRDLVGDAANLVRQEIALAKAEVVGSVKRAVKGAGQAAAGGLFGVIGLLLLVVCLVIGLGVLLGGNYWFSSLIVALLCLSVGGGLAFMGMRRLQGFSLAPENAIESAQDTQRWLTDEVREFRDALGSETARL